MVRIGVAMLQGARHEHCEAIQHAALEMNIAVEIVELRKASQVDSSLDGLILPGGESTTMRIASQSESLLEELFNWLSEFPNKPVLGTCAGAILLANPGQNQEPFIDVEVSRNAWGRQRFSFEAPVKVSLETPEKSHESTYEVSRDKFNHKPLPIYNQAATTNEDFPGVFIRAPRFIEDSIKCQKIATLNEETVGVLQDKKLALSFHPELTNDRRFHRWLIDQIINNSS
tara:strand:- start:4519 stop:5205 length:687 start_codon:yes stop_codon:yes gene_type:complete